MNIRHHYNNVIAHKLTFIFEYSFSFDFVWVELNGLEVDALPYKALDFTLSQTLYNCHIWKYYITVKLYQSGESSKRACVSLYIISFRHNNLPLRKEVKYFLMRFDDLARLFIIKTWRCHIIASCFHTDYHLSSPQQQAT